MAERKDAKAPRSEADLGGFVRDIQTIFEDIDNSVISYYRTNPNDRSIHLSMLRNYTDVIPAIETKISNLAPGSNEVLVLQLLTHLIQQYRLQALKTYWSSTETPPPSLIIMSLSVACNDYLHNLSMQNRVLEALKTEIASKYRPESTHTIADMEHYLKEISIFLAQKEQKKDVDELSGKLQKIRITTTEDELDYLKLTFLFSCSSIINSEMSIRRKYEQAGGWLQQQLSMASQTEAKAKAAAKEKADKERAEAEKAKADAEAKRKAEEERAEAEAKAKAAAKEKADKERAEAEKAKADAEAKRKAEEERAEAEAKAKAAAKEKAEKELAAAEKAKAEAEARRKAEEIKAIRTEKTEGKEVKDAGAKLESKKLQRDETMGRFRRQVDETDRRVETGTLSIEAAIKNYAGIIEELGKMLKKRIPENTQVLLKEFQQMLSIFRIKFLEKFKKERADRAPSFIAITIGITPEQKEQKLADFVEGFKKKVDAIDTAVAGGEVNRDVAKTAYRGVLQELEKTKREVSSEQPSKVTAAKIKLLSELQAQIQVFRIEYIEKFEKLITSKPPELPSLSNLHYSVLRGRREHMGRGDLHESRSVDELQVQAEQNEDRYAELKRERDRLLGVLQQIWSRILENDEKCKKVLIECKGLAADVIGKSLLPIRQEYQQMCEELSGSQKKLQQLSIHIGMLLTTYKKQLRQLTQKLDTPEENLGAFKDVASLAARAEKTSIKINNLIETFEVDKKILIKYRIEFIDALIKSGQIVEMEDATAVFEELWRKRQHEVDWEFRRKLEEDKILNGTPRPPRPGSAGPDRS